MLRHAFADVGGNGNRARSWAKFVRRWPVEPQRYLLDSYPRIAFKESIIRAFAQGFAHKPETTFGTVNADVLAEKLPGYERSNFCAIIRGSRHST